MDEKMEFVNCDGNCGHILLMVPKGTTQFICPRERSVHRPLQRSCGEEKGWGVGRGEGGRGRITNNAKKRR